MLSMPCMLRLLRPLSLPAPPLVPRCITGPLPGEWAAVGAFPELRDL